MTTEPPGDPDPDADPLLDERLRAAATAAAMPALHGALERFRDGVEASSGVDGAWWSHFATAVGELGANVVRYAYPDGTPSGAFDLRLLLYPSRAEAHFADDGVPFVEPPPADPLDLDALMELPESGRGLEMIRTAVDELRYERAGGRTNRWTLVKRLP